ncbi:diaminopropionate ammonia-lyase [Aquibaculum arenosum]|uniref:Diaminopropionate ammonia-lyase n=1 Tax=Aquibaculum arenosum TaxID=3032591 RepID=A0ABT5YM34_9PROT|nr:diaminopropionate ammonia-lyase [Fodinicurvata sp. CAU 1616]MDF2095891.1 diaminopropionate ammonia-lyase [Fodinicurvata sp. CAU 1616]
MLQPPPRILDQAHLTVTQGPWPAALDAVLSPAMAEAALTEIADWPGYAPTPIHRLDRLAEALGLGAIYYKDEGHRFALESFKALGGAYGVLRLAAAQVAERSGATPALSRIRAGEFREQLHELTVTTATDGNHGRSVAWGAQMAGCRCRIYIHATVSSGRQQAMEALGAEVVRIEGDYDESVIRCARDSEENGWFVVSDTSYEGYTEVPREVMAGYSVMASEALEQLADAPPTHLFIQGGVGGVAAALCARFWQGLGERRPRTVVVEPASAACILATARAGSPTQVPLEEETLMAGLSCGTISLLAWDILKAGASDYLSIGEEGVAPAMRLLASGEAGGGAIVAGESAVAGLIGLTAAAQDEALRAGLGLGPDSRVFLLGSEGATDPDIYRRLVGSGPHSV